MDVFTVVFGGLLAFFVIAVLLLGVFSQRSPREYLDWKPTRSPATELANEIDDVEQMLAAQNAMRRRRGAPEITADDIEASTRAQAEEMRRWRES